jgi:hypothetical protein
MNVNALAPISDGRWSSSTTTDTATPTPVAAITNSRHSGVASAATV